MHAAHNIEPAMTADRAPRLTRPAAALRGLALAAALLAPPALASDPLPASAEGEALYAERCASCHDQPGGRAPARDVLAKNPPAFVLRALHGIMAPMADGLSEDQRKAIALYVVGSPLGAGDPDPQAIWGPSSAEMPLDGPRCAGDSPPVDLSAGGWNGWGRTPDNARYQPDPGFSAAEAPRLKLKWAFRYPGSKNGQATVIGPRLFVTSMSGAVYALDARTGCVWWRHDAGAPTRSSVSVGPMPAGSGHRAALYYSDWSKSAAALDADTGELIWKTQVDASAGVQMTGAPLLYKDVLLVPVASGDEAFAQNDRFECCRFVGSVAALDARSGQVLWKRLTTDQAPHVFKTNRLGVPMWGPAGGGVWSAPTVDEARGLVYAATSNSYTDVHHDGADAIIAMDLRTGEVRWKRQMIADDDYIIGCPAAANCPAAPGEDHEFGASVILRAMPDGRQALLAGQKSGDLYALDPDAGGRILWRRRLGGGSALGGVEFGLAADSEAVYAGISDVVAKRDPKPQLAAIRIADGQVLWTAPSPPLPCRWRNVFCSGAISMAVTAAPGMVFAASMNGHLRVYASGDGRVLWDFDTAAGAVADVAGRPVQGGAMDGAGPTVAGGMVYVHSGYGGRSTPRAWDLSGAEGNVLMAFSVDGR